MPEDYHIPYRYVTKEEAEKEAIERRKDTTWHKCHSFEHGWFWRRCSDDMNIYWWDLNKRNIKFEDFPKLETTKIEEVVSEVNEDNRIKAEWHKANPIKVTFNTITMPKFIKEVGNMPDIRDLVGVQPII